MADLLPTSKSGKTVMSVVIVVLAGGLAFTGYKYFKYKKDLTAIYTSQGKTADEIAKLL